MDPKKDEVKLAWKGEEQLLCGEALPGVPPLHFIVKKRPFCQGGHMFWGAPKPVCKSLDLTVM